MSVFPINTCPLCGYNRKEMQSALRLEELVKANCDPKCDCEYGDCYHSKCEQMIKESEK